MQVLHLYIYTYTIHTHENLYKLCIYFYLLFKTIKTQRVNVYNILLIRQVKIDLYHKLLCCHICYRRGYFKIIYNTILGYLWKDKSENGVRKILEEGAIPLGALDTKLIDRCAFNSTNKPPITVAIYEYIVHAI